MKNIQNVKQFFVFNKKVPIDSIDLIKEEAIGRIVLVASATNNHPEMKKPLATEIASIIGELEKGLGVVALKSNSLYSGSAQNNNTPAFEFIKEAAKKADTLVINTNSILIPGVKELIQKATGIMLISTEVLYAGQMLHIDNVQKTFCVYFK